MCQQPTSAKLYYTSHIRTTTLTSLLKTVECMQITAQIGHGIIVKR